MQTIFCFKQAIYYCADVSPVTSRRLCVRGIETSMLLMGLYISLIRYPANHNPPFVYYCFSAFIFFYWTELNNSICLSLYIGRIEGGPLLILLLFCFRVQIEWDRFAESVKTCWRKEYNIRGGKKLESNLFVEIRRQITRRQRISFSFDKCE